MRKIIKWFAHCILAVMITVALALFYSTRSGYTTWYHLNSSVQILVEGRPASGWLQADRSGRSVFLTLENSQGKQTYHFVFTNGRISFAAACKNWRAPHLPAFPIGDVSPPCWDFAETDKPGELIFLDPVKDLVGSKGSLQFKNRSNQLVKASWSD
jgi:hypothetical protein